MTNPAHTAPAADIEGQAQRWFVRLLDDDLDPRDIVEWERWLNASPDHRAAYDRIAQSWELAGVINVETPSPAELAGDRYDGAAPVALWRKRRKAGLRLVFGGLAAVLVVALGLTVSVWSDRPIVQQFATMRGERLDAHLSDGSMIRVGGLTNLDVKFRARQRGVGLANGEAFFTVAHDRTRPFTVATPLAAITAVGTAFNIDVGALKVTLDVTEGVVSVALRLGPAEAGSAAPAVSVVRVAAGQRLRMESDGATLRAVQSPAAFAPSWTEGRLEYRDEPLAAVVEDVNRYASRPIVIADPGLGALTYTGTVHLNATDDWLRALSTAFPLTVDLSNSRQVTLKEKSLSTLPGNASKAS